MCQYPQLFDKQNHLRDLTQGYNIIAEYIWIDGQFNIRSKCRTINKSVQSLTDIPDWNYDGSSCYQADTKSSEVIMKPVAYFKDPFRLGNNILVLTETYNWKDQQCTELVPTNTNFRHYAKMIFDDQQVKNEHVQFGLEQEYIMIGNNILGWPQNGFPEKQGQYYCSVGANSCFGRIIQDNHYKACLYAGINIAGTNFEVMPGQCEYQIGICDGIDIGDHLWMSRYILQRVAETFNINISFAPKLHKEWNGSGCHTNYSTLTMRNGLKGMNYIEDVVNKLKDKHQLHIKVYGQDNQKRLTGHHETSSFTQFSYGVGNRAASVRIPTQVFKNGGRGYIEDRRPASNIDPYIVCSLIADTTLLEKTLAQPLIKHFDKYSQTYSQF